ncbi:TfoX/Sxy family DNA transformation protein [Elstera sp.]|jgi:DNA transformation protein|uniref:TfoX/Sxy family DNA transformation protein n=1 Tax=Elstera sp. TaxID=1916664 RepID=UPI0037BFDB37
MPTPDAPSSLRNLGPRMDQMLREVGIDTVADLRALGAEEAWHRLRFRFGRRVTRVALYALDGALTDRDWRYLPEDRLAILKTLKG